MSRSSNNTPIGGGVPHCLTIKQLMERTGLGRTTISQALSRGDLEHYRIGARAVIPETAVVQWLNAHRISKKPALRRQLPQAQP